MATPVGAIPSSMTSTGVMGGGVGLSTDGFLAMGDVGLSIVSIDEAVVGDEGGWTIVASGAFPTTQPVMFRVQDGGTLDELCYSGVVGSAEWSQTTDGITAEFVVPPLPVGGPRQGPPPPRQVGPYDVRDEPGE